MSRTVLAKTRSDALIDFIDEYQKEHRGPVRMENVAKWVIDHGLYDPPFRNPAKELARELRKAAREKRIEDAQGRRVRAMHAAKAERVDANGNRIFDVVWDHIHDMSADHATRSFTQRCENIAKQSNALNRDVQSFNDNNPNAPPGGIQLTFDAIWSTPEPSEQIVEEIQETGKPKPR